MSPQAGAGCCPPGVVISAGVDPSIIITPAVTLIGIGVGYAGGVQKGKADLRVERERTAQLREERAEDFRQRRATAYHDLLNAASGIVGMLRSGTARLPAINAALANLENHVNGIRAFGAASTHAPADAMLAALQGDGSGHRDLDAYNRAREEFVAAAHNDVGPEALNRVAPSRSIRERF